MKKMKETKGITLVALVITIIVMLILVGISVAVVLNGGLIEKTKEAKAKTEMEKTKEMLYSEAMLYLGNNGKVDMASLNNKNINGYTIEVDNLKPYYATATKNGAPTLYITANGSIIEQ